MSLRQTLFQICADAPNKTHIPFEQIYRTVYNMCIHKKHAEVHACFIEVIERIHGTEHADLCYTILQDVLMYYNATCIYNNLPTFATMYENYRPKPAQYDTPPSTP